MAMPRMIVAPALTASSPQPVPRRRFLGGLVAAVAGGTFFSQVRDAFAAPAPAPNATTGLDPFIGEIAMVPYNFVPQGWALCDGSLLSIGTNTALFSLLGTNFGGNGVTTFGLPDLRGRFPMGLHPTFYPYPGLVGGEAAHTLSAVELPVHGHTLMCDANNGTADSPANAVPARNPAGIPAWSASGATAMSAGAITGGGSGQAHNNLPPYQVISFIIALQGIYPSRA
jgi:microcystin-dependent protein